VTILRTPDDDERARKRRDVEWLWLALVVLVALTVVHELLAWCWRPSSVFTGGIGGPVDP
jgi:hypothetical protein